MQQDAKLSHLLFSKINANSVTCQVENILSFLTSDSAYAVSHMLPAESNTHYPGGIVPPSDRLWLSAHSFLCCSACVTLSSLCSPCMCQHLCGILLCCLMCACVTDSCHFACTCALQCFTLQVYECDVLLMFLSTCQGCSLWCFMFGVLCRGMLCILQCEGFV